MEMYTIFPKTCEFILTDIEVKNAQGRKKFKQPKLMSMMQISQPQIHHKRWNNYCV